MGREIKAFGRGPNVLKPNVNLLSKQSSNISMETQHRCPTHREDTGQESVTYFRF